MSLRCKEGAVPKAIESFRRAKFKFPGRQKIVISKKWGFTAFKKDEYLEQCEAGKSLTLLLSYVLTSQG